MGVSAGSGRGCMDTMEVWPSSLLDMGPQESIWSRGREWATADVEPVEFEGRQISVGWLAQKLNKAGLWWRKEWKLAVI